MSAKPKSCSPTVSFCSAWNDKTCSCGKGLVYGKTVCRKPKKVK